ncbi:MAG: hypothetical protein IKP24_00800 [Alphaproteobacteria bacterium]|nr:hypothetical protein [Alphaproteobacteria bacterium]
MNIVHELIEYISSCKNILCQIRQHGDNLEFETWIYSGTIKINDQFMLKTPDLYFEVLKYNVLLVGETRYRFSLHRESDIMRYPKHPKLFDRIFAPTIFRACNKKYKEREKQK